MYPMQHIYKESDQYNFFYTWFECMHTRIDIVLCDKSEEDAKRIMQIILNELFKLENIGNCYDSSSELSILNNSLINTPITIDPDLFSMIEMCCSYNITTNGYFDISIHSDNHTVDTLQCIEMSKKDWSITIKREGVKLNLSSFIKGYALDKIKEVLQKNDVQHALINMGNSSVLAMGNHPLGDGWKVGFDFPMSTNEKKEVVLKNECLTTSGNDTDMRKHIKSPFTGKYVEGQRGVSVVTSNATDGEALSTALFAAEPHERNKILQQFEATIYDL